MVYGENMNCDLEYKIIKVHSILKDCDPDAEDNFAYDYWSRVMEALMKQLNEGRTLH